MLHPHRRIVPSTLAIVLAVALAPACAAARAAANSPAVVIDRSPAPATVYVVRGAVEAEEPLEAAPAVPFRTDSFRLETEGVLAAPTVAGRP